MIANFNATAREKEILTLRTEIERLAESKRHFSALADAKGKENVALRMAIRAAHYALTKSSLTADERVHDAAAALARTFEQKV